MSTDSARKHVSFAASAAVVLLLALAAGCGPAADRKLPVFPASGSVKYQGKPAAGATIALVPKTRQADAPHEPNATIAEDGTFKLSTYATGDGAPAGEYGVKITWHKFITDAGGSGLGPNVLPRKYADPKTSGIEVKITEGSNSIPEIVIE